MSGSLEAGGGPGMEIRCGDCGNREPHAELYMYAADLGEGAFLKVLCEVCWHRREYRAELKSRRAHTAHGTKSQYDTGQKTGSTEGPP